MPRELRRRTFVRELWPPSVRVREIGSNTAPAEDRPRLRTITWKNHLGPRETKAFFRPVVGT